MKYTITTSTRSHRTACTLDSRSQNHENGACKQPHEHIEKSDGDTRTLSDLRRIPDAPPEEIYMNWSNILGSRRITSPDDLKPIIEALQHHIYKELEQHHIVIIE